MNNENKKFNVNKDELRLIKQLVSIKISELSTFKKVRYALTENNIITRSSYESIKITNYLNKNYNKEFIYNYLSILKKEINDKKIDIIDNSPIGPKNVTDDFLNWIEKQLIEIELKETNIKNPFPKIFIDYKGYLIFEKYLKDHIVTPYKDLSFLFQKLNSENRLTRIKHMEFAEFMLENKFIKEKEFLIISDKKGFDKKSESEQRLNNYYTIASKIS